MSAQLFCHGLSTTTTTQPKSKTATNPRSIITNLLKICNLVQDSTHYSSEWADQIIMINQIDANANKKNNDNNCKICVSKSSVTKGTILSLYPVHAIGVCHEAFQFHSESDILVSAISTTNNHNFDFYDYWPNLQNQYQYPYPNLLLNDKLRWGGLLVRIAKSLPPLSQHHDKIGWRGHVVPTSIKKSNKDKLPTTSANCIMVPLPGAAPMCALVATCDIPQGQPLHQQQIIAPLEKQCTSFDNDICQQEQHELISNLVDLILRRYPHEIGELQDYMNYAYPNDVILVPKHYQPYSFLPIHHGDLVVLHKNPDIYSIPNFLTNEECDRIIQKASCQLKPCVVQNPTTGIVEQDDTRTSTNANIPQREIPTVVSKILNLGHGHSLFSKYQLEIFQVLKYEKGQYFKPHVDGFDNGPVTACGFVKSNRLATIFCYLNDMESNENGGDTKFTKLGISVRPQKGMAVIHFPTSIIPPLQTDEQTEHEGCPPLLEGSTKWLLVTWIWMHPRQDARYRDDNLPTLNSDII